MTRQTGCAQCGRQVVPAHLLDGDARYEAGYAACFETAQDRIRWLEECLTDDREKWSFDTLTFLAEQLLDKVYPPDLFDPPSTLSGDPGAKLATALREVLAAKA